MTSPYTSATAAKPPRRRRRIWLWVLGVLVLLLLAAQLVRFFVPSLQLTNPPVTQTVAWDSAETQQLFTAACADCHSNETVYPWYSYIAPVGWLVASDVHGGRDEYNISEPGEIDADEMVEELERGHMPPPIYLPMHPEANLSEAQVQALSEGILATFR